MNREILTCGTAMGSERGKSRKYLDWPIFVHNGPSKKLATQLFKCLVDEVLLGNAHVEGLSIHGESVGAGGFDSFRQKQDVHESLPRFAPQRVKTYTVLVWSCIAGNI
jgi:hypothetical protein